MKIQPVNDLQLMFLELIAEETPEATAALFKLGDGGKPLMNLLASLEWMEHYGVYADWLEMFLRDVLEQGQAHIDWAVKQRFDEETDVTRLSVAEKAWLEIYRKRRKRWQPKEKCSASASAWLRTLKTYQSGQALLREASKRHPDRITYSDSVIDKRKGEEHCLWLVQWRFGGKSDADIRRDTDVSRSEIGKLRRKFADDIDLDLKKRRRS